MTDIVDMAGEIEREHLARAIAAARVPIPAGAPGECERCGEDMPRLVDGWCAPCRDGRRRVAAPRIAAPEIAAPGAAQDDNREEDAMGQGRQISFRARGEVLAAIEAQAAAGDGVLGTAALALVERGLAAGMEAAATPEAQPTPAHILEPRELISWLLGEVERVGEVLLERAENAAGAAELEELEERLGAAIAEREAAEARVAQLRAVLG